MKVSVIVPTYSMDRYEDFCEAADAVLNQTYDNVELVVIVDGNPEVYEHAVEDYGDYENVVIYMNHDDAGPLSRANMGAIQATGDIVALTDDDAVPQEDWIEVLVETYEEYDAVAVGGRIVPEWVVGEAEFIPEEFFFLIGATHRDYPDEIVERRNTFGANLSFKRDIYLELGGIKQGGIDPRKVQGRETEFCARMERFYGRGVVYNPDAVVSHKIYEFRTNPRWLVERAFWQGYSKRAMEVLVPNSSEEESDYLRNLLVKYIPGRIGGLLTNFSQVKLAQLLTLFILLGATGIGYLYGLLRWR